MKKLVSLMLALIMVLSVVMLASCSSDDENTTKTPTTTEETTGTTTDNTGDTTTSAPVITDPSAKLQSIVREEIKSALEVAYGIKDINSTPVLADEFALNAQAKIKISQELITMLSTMLGQGEEQAIDLSFLKEIVVDAALNKSGNAFAANGSLGLNGVTILEGTVNADLETMAAAILLPLISDKYIELPMEQIMMMLEGILYGSGIPEDDWDIDIEFPGLTDTDDEWDGEWDGEWDDEWDDEWYNGPLVPSMSMINWQMIASLVEKVLPALPDKETAEKIVNRYTDIILSKLTDIAASSETVTVGEISETFAALSLRIDGNAYVEIIKAVLTTLKTDEDIKNVINAIEEALSIPGEDIDVSDPEDTQESAYDQFIEQIEIVLSALNEDTDQIAKSFPTFTAVAYFDKDEAYKGLSYNVTVQDQTAFYSQNQSISYRIITLVEGEKTVVLADSTFTDGTETQSVSCTYTGIDKNGLINGSVVLTYNDETLFTLKIEGFDKAAAAEGKLVGKISTNVSDIFNVIEKCISANAEDEDTQINMQLAVVKALFGNMELYVEYKADDKSQTAICALASASKNLIAIEFKVSEGDSAEINEIGEKTTLEEVMADLDKEAVVEKLAAALKQANVPDVLIEALKASISAGEDDFPPEDYVFPET